MPSSRLVLVADDHADSRYVLRAILEHYGHKVLEVENGHDCVRVAREHRPDMIFTDLRMPLMDGWEAVLRIKADPATAGTPIVAVTASAFKEDAERALQAGCARVLVKPVGIRDLLATLESITAGPDPLPAL